MALTDKKRRFVQALQSGLSGAEAAVQAGYSKNGASQAASRLMKDADVLAALGRKKKVNEVNNQVNKEQPEEKTETGSEVVDVPAPGTLSALGLTSDPKKVLVAIMNDLNEDPKLRLEAAKALMPFTHGRIAPQGKKEAKDEGAKKAAGRFTPQPPPLKMVPK